MNQGLYSVAEVTVMIANNDALLLTDNAALLSQLSVIENLFLEET